jgi:hypothetical protein
MNIATLALSKSYTDAKLMKDLKSVELIDDNTLQFTLGNGSKSNIDLNGLLSAEQISKLDSIDSQFLDRFSVDETSGALLFDKNPISKENITKLEDWVQHGTYTQFQLVSYMGKLYRLKFNVVDAIITPDINPANYELFSGGSGGSSSIKFAGFTPNNEYSFADPIIYNDCLMTAKSSFRSGNDIDLNDWNIISDMHKRVYDVDGNAIVDKADHANIADLALETTLVQTWKPNKDYTAGQNLVYNYETYTVTNNYTSGLIFDKTNLTLSATGNHNGLNSLQGGDSVNGEYYHINKSKHDIIDNITDLNGRLAYYDKALGDMDKSIYDVNNDGIVDKASTLDGLASTVTELNYIHGAKGNIQAQIDALSSIGNFTGSAPTYADIATLFSSPKQKDMVIVITDEKKQRSIYNILI